MLFKDPFHWFPDPYFSTILFLLVLSMYLVDYTVPRVLARRRSGQPVLVQDRSSFLVIQIAGIVSIALAIVFRYLGLTITPRGVQYLGLILIPAGLVMREWAIIKLGRFFSRTVQIEPGHELITSGPYHWIRHPAYTGMILIYLGIALTIGTWLGAATTLALMLAATMYRIGIEEQVLTRAFGNEYRDYMTHTWRLFPGW